MSHRKGKVAMREMREEHNQGALGMGWTSQSDGLQPALAEPPCLWLSCLPNSIYSISKEPHNYVASDRY